jgi:hypothetical protein
MGVRVGDDASVAVASGAEVDVRGGGWVVAGGSVAATVGRTASVGTFTTTGTVTVDVDGKIAARIGL